MALIRHAQAEKIARDAIVLDLGDVQRQAAQLMEQARRRAEEMVAQARAEREKIIAGAAEKGRADGLAKGMEEGKRAGAEQGKAAAVTEWRAKLDQIEKRWGESLKVFEGERNRMLTEARTDVLRLALGVAEKVVKRVVEVDVNVVTDQLQAVLSLVARPTELLMSINPEDRVVAEAALPALMARFQSVRHVELVEDAKVTRGSCVARTRAQSGGEGSAGGGEIDASIEDQLRQMAELLLPSKAANGGEA
jgi:flagellar assembly protein FliH